MTRSPGSTRVGGRGVTDRFPSCGPRWRPGCRGSRTFFYREPAGLDQQLRGAGLAVVTMTEEITSRHWLKILAEVG